MYNQSASIYCNHNATNGSKVVCIINNKTQHQHQHESTYLPEYSMDISLFSYMYTLFLAFGCYSFLNPVAARMFMLNTLIRIAKYSITGYGLFKEYVYKPYVKHVHPKLLRLLHIDDGKNEVLVIKNNKVIHSFKTMEMFVKNNPIKFVKEFSDEGDAEESEQESQEGQEEGGEHHESQDSSNPNDSLSDKVDYNKKCEQLNELIEAFKLHTLEDKPSEKKTETETETDAIDKEDSEATSAPAQEETEESEESEESEDTDDTPDDYILDPTAYDFIIRNFYYEDEKTGETNSYVFKYDIFYKSEMNEKYDVNMIKDKYFSSRKFIGISLKQNGEKYNINLTTPNNYYVSDNSILNYSFMKWYMMKHYNVNLSKDYLISCIDNYVEMYKIHPGKKIFVHKNRFEVVDDETFVNDNTSEDEGNGDVDSDSDSETEHEYEEKSENQEEKTENGTKSSSKYLEDTHEMCDIEILDYD